MTEQDRKRINDYIHFLRKTFRFLVWAGVVFMGMGTFVGLLANGTPYFQLSPGFLFIGAVLLLRAVFQLQQIPDAGMISNPEFFQNEMDELMARIKFFSFFLIATVMASILVTFVTQWRYLIPTLIILVLYVVSEYIVWNIIRFRLQLLKQELRMEQ